MTREEAIEILRNEYLCVDKDCDIERSCRKCPYAMPAKEPILEAYSMAIKALEQEPTKEERALLQKWRDNRGISIEDFEDAMNALQEPKTGHWIEKDGFDGDVYYDCSECGESWTTIEGTPWDNEWNYCPNCGCRMFEPQESEGKE